MKHNFFGFNRSRGKKGPHDTNKTKVRCTRGVISLTQDSVSDWSSLDTKVRNRVFD